MEPDINRLEEIANNIRRDIIKSLLEAGSGHSAGPLGMADVFTALYFHVLNHQPENPKWEDRDRFVLSNAHICPVLYATMAHAGYFPVQELMTLRKLGTRLHGHPHKNSLPGLEASGGPLGQGLSIAVGMALTAKIDNKSWRVYCMTGDGEIEEGQAWEAFMFAGKNKLHNLTFIIDRNNIQIDGFTEDVMALEPLRDKLESFGLHVIEVDAHNIRHVIDACNEARAVFEKPTAIIAHSIPGKGVDFMEFKYEWHGKPPNAEEARKALEELDKLRTLGGKIIGEHQ
ncbi:transketolase [Candidatus Woesearchaeota archaeon]|nr:transketolase [Candidatus Woesearchaeota archaeon]